MSLPERGRELRPKEVSRECTAQGEGASRRSARRTLGSISRAILQCGRPTEAFRVGRPWGALGRAQPVGGCGEAPDVPPRWLVGHSVSHSDISTLLSLVRILTPSCAAGRGCLNPGPHTGGGGSQSSPSLEVRTRASNKAAQGKWGPNFRITGPVGNPITGGSSPKRSTQRRLEHRPPPNPTHSGTRRPTPRPLSSSQIQQERTSWSSPWWLLCCWGAEGPK